MSLLNRIQDYFRKEVAPSVFSRGMLCYFKGDFIGARDRFERAARHRPSMKQDALYNAYWALSLSRTGDEADAVESLKGLREKLDAHPLAGRVSVDRAIKEIEEILGE